MSAQYDFVLDKSATFVRTIVWKDNNIPIVLTDYDAVFTIRQSPSSDEMYLNGTKHIL